MKNAAMLGANGHSAHAAHSSAHGTAHSATTRLLLSGSTHNLQGAASEAGTTDGAESHATLPQAPMSPPITLSTSGTPSGPLPPLPPLAQLSAAGAAAEDPAGVGEGQESGFRVEGPGETTPPNTLTHPAGVALSPFHPAFTASVQHLQGTVQDMQGHLQGALSSLSSGLAVAAQESESVKREVAELKSGLARIEAALTALVERQTGIIRLDSLVASKQAPDLPGAAP